MLSALARGEGNACQRGSRALERRISLSNIPALRRRPRQLDGRRTGGRDKKSVKYEFACQQEAI